MSNDIALKPRVPAVVQPLVRPHARKIINAVYDFVEEYCIPLERQLESEIHEIIKSDGDPFARQPDTIERAKFEARRRGLWNLWLHQGMHGDSRGAGLSNVEYAICAEVMGRSIKLAPEAMNSAAPDTGNMEVLAKYGTTAQQKQWLDPLLEGRIRSCYCMTERRVASSDATNIETSIKRDGDSYVINGRKWWNSGGGRARCRLLIVMGKSDPSNPNKHRQQSMIIVPRDSPGVTIIRYHTVFGYSDAPEGHFEIDFKNVRVPVSNIILGEGRGFEIAQGRLGPGRIHHCMRTIGVAERCMDLMMIRATDPARKPFGKFLHEHGAQSERIAQSRIDIDMGRLLVLAAAQKLDREGARAALVEIAQAKVEVPKLAARVLDRAIQMFGAEGVSQDQALAELSANVRTIRIVDGPSEVHMMQIARNEIKHAEVLKKTEIWKQYHAARL